MSTALEFPGLGLAGLEDQDIQAGFADEKQPAVWDSKVGHSFRPLLKIEASNLTLSEVRPLQNVGVSNVVTTDISPLAVVLCGLINVWLAIRSDYDDVVRVKTPDAFPRIFQIKHVTDVGTGEPRFAIADEHADRGIVIFKDVFHL